MADLGQAYVEIVPKAPGISNKISNLIKPGSAKAGKEGGDSAGANLVKGIKRAIIAAGIGKAVVGVFKSAIDEGSKLQQSYGGLETIYGDAADAAKKYASEASKVGISANDYAEQAVSFGASLKQAFSGDTTKAVEAANTAIMDMTDNAAKMGTPIESIQTAYQGFAKQNYTMLDNLKLGYGGTKSEMERLLADAQKISGVKYNINNLGDVYDAIHVIQGDLGLTGVAAKEAAETFSGSFGAMKASLQNVMGALSTGGDIEGPIKDFVNNAVTFLAKNLVPMVVTVFKSLPGAIATAVPELIDGIKETLTTSVSAGTGGTVIPMSEKVMQWMGYILGKIGEAIVTYAPIVWEKFKEILGKLRDLIVEYAPIVWDKFKSLLGKLRDYIAENIPTWREKGKELLQKLEQAFVQYAPVVIDAIKSMISSAVQYIAEHAPEWAEKGKEMLHNLAQGFVENLPDMLAALGRLVAFILENLAQLAGSLILAGLELIDGLAQGIIDGASTLIRPAMESVRNAVHNAIESVKTMVVNTWNQIKNAVLNSAFVTAIVNIWNQIKTKTQSIWLGIKNAIMTPINAAKTAVQNAINMIRNIIGGARLELPHFKLPHFVISGGELPWGIGGKGKKPTIDVQWYAKGGIFDEASIIGVGEAGREAAIPLQGNAMRPFARAIADEMSGGNVFNITVNNADNPEEFADRLVRQIKLRTRMA